MKIDNFLQTNNLTQAKNILDNSSTTGATGTDNSNGGLSFVDTLKEKLDDVNSQQLEADAVTEAFIKGDNVDVHEVMIAATEAQQSLQMAVQVRNKLVEAFQEINRMQL